MLNVWRKKFHRCTFVPGEYRFYTNFCKTLLKLIYDVKMSKYRITGKPNVQNTH